MKRYTGTAKRIIAAISCAAMVLSNVAGDFQTITAYADEATEQSVDGTSQNKTAPEGQPEAQAEEGEDAHAVEEETSETPKDTAGDPEGENAGGVEDPKDEGSSEEGEEEKKEGVEPENSANSGQKEKDESVEGQKDTSAQEEEDESSEKEEQPSGEDGTEEGEIVTPKEPAATDPIEEPQETLLEQVDETTNIRFVAEYIGYYYDYAYDEELGEETEQQFTKEIADSQTLTIGKDSAYSLADNAPTVDGWAFDYLTIDEEDYDDAEIAIGTDKDEEKGTETFYYTINGNRVDASEEERTITVTYLYMSTGNDGAEELSTSAYTLKTLYRCGENKDKSSIFQSGSLAIQYSTNGTDWTTITDYTQFGLDQDFQLEPSDPSTTIDTYQVTLPDDKGYSYRLTGTLSDTSEYALSYDSNNNLIVEQLAAQSVKVTWHDGKNSYQTRVSSDTYLESLKVTGNDKSEYKADLKDTTAPGYVTMEESEDNGTWTITFLNLPLYDSGNNVIEYKVSSSWDQQPADTKTTDVVKDTTYKQTITNQYSNSTTEIYLEPADKQSSEVEYSLTAKTDYKAHKQWIDDGGTEDNRPTVSLTLYRYPDKTGSSYENASPEPDAKVGLDNSTHLIAITNEYELEAYDTDGYLYKYIAKESMSGGDSYQLCTYDVTSKQYVPVANNFIENGEKVYNVIQKTTSLSYTKNFIAKDVQDRNITVRFELQRTTVTDANGDPDWTKPETVETSEEENTLSGFNEKVTTKTGSFSGLPTEDNYSAPNSTTLGQKVYYRVVEKQVTLYENDKEVDTAEPEDGYITLDGIRYESTSVTDEETGDVTITNRLVGNAEVVINKSFPGGFANGASSFTGTFTVYRNGEAIGTKEITYNSSNGGVDAIKTWGDLTTVDASCTAEAGDRTGELPRYDEDGAEYVYTVLEAPSAGYYATINSNKAYQTYGADAKYAGEEYLICNVDAANNIDDGDPWIHIAKQWNDDSQRMYRANVGFRIDVSMVVNGETKTVTYVADGTIGQYETGVDLKFSHDWINTNFGTNWTASETVAKVNAWKNTGYPETATTEGAIGIKIREITLGGNTVVSAGTENDLTKANKAHKPDCDFASANDQQYDVTYTNNKTIDQKNYDLVIVNTRIGTNRIVLDKTWVDGNNYRGQRPEQIKVTVTATVDGKAADVWSDGTNTLNPATGEAASETATIKGEAGTNAANMRVYTLSDANGTGDSFTVDGTAHYNHWVFTSDDLRKYDDEGKVINYTVSAEYVNGEGDDVLSTAGYTQTNDSYAAASVEYGSNHTNDVETFTYRNEYRGSVPLSVYKIWEDDGSGQSRPDIYMTIFRKLKVGEDASHNAIYGKIDGNGCYTGVNVGAGGEGSDNQNLGYVNNDWMRRSRNCWYVTFDAQERYNSQGYEWVYFIVEQFSSNNTNDYVCVGAYDQVPNPDGDLTKDTTFTGGTKNDKITYTNKSGESVENYVVQMKVTKDGAGNETWTSGTLVNRPVNTRDVKGTKTWSVPAGYGFEDGKKPAIKVELYRVSYKNAQQWKTGHTDAKGNVIWNDIFNTGNESYIEKVTRHADTDQDGSATAFTSDELTKTLSEDTTYAYEWLDVDRYDSEGGRYTYIVKETYADATDTSVSIKVDQIWNQTVDDEGGVTNIFKEDQGYSVTFTKDWSVTNLKADSYGTVPKITIKLVRYLQNKSGAKSGNAEVVAINPTIVKDGGTTASKEKSIDNAAGDGTVTITFMNYPDADDKSGNARTQRDEIKWSNLPYYGTNGRPYIYEVQETSSASLGGMKITNTKGDVDITDEDEDGVNDLASAPVTGTYDSDEKTGSGSAQIKNEYGQVRGAINVEKKWVTSSDDVSAETDAARKAKVTNLGYLKNSLVANGQNASLDATYKVDVTSPISFDLFRNTANTSSTSAKSLNTTLGLADSAIANNAGVLGADNSWKTRITDLEMFDGEGRTYYYYVTEKSSDPFYVSQYYDQATTYQPAVKNEVGATLNTVTLTNTPKVETVKATKVWNSQNYKNNNWVNDTLNQSPDLAKLDDLGALPDSITYTVQYRISGTAGTSNVSFSGDWKTLYKESTASDANAVTITGNIEHATKNARGEITTAGDYTYAASMANLPSYVYQQNGDEIKGYQVEYRAIETSMKFGAETKTVDNVTTDSNKNRSAFTIGVMKGSDTTTNNVTTTTNVIPVQTLKIRKIWDDELDRDDLRPDSLTVTIENNSNNKTTTMVLNTPVGTLPTPATSTENWEDNSEYANYYINHLKKNNRPINAAAVWEGSVEMPAGVKTTVTETAPSGYTPLTYSSTSWAPGTKESTVSSSVEAAATDYTVTLANKTATMQAFNLTVSKTFTKTANNKAVWSTGTTANANGYYTVTIPADDEAYIQLLKEHGLAFKLQYQLAGETAYHDVDATDKSRWGLGESGSIEAIHAVKFGDDQNNLTFTTNKQESTNELPVVDFTFKVDGWNNLPVNMYTNNGSKAVTYKVIEGFVNESGTFTALSDVTETWFTNNWDAASSVTTAEGITSTAGTASFTDVPQYKTITATKSWQTLAVKADGTVDTTVNGGKPQAADDEMLRTLNRYKGLPASIVYQAQYQFLSGSDKTWHNFTIKDLNGNDDGLIGYPRDDYQAVYSQLPAYQIDATDGEAREVQYRAIEAKMTFEGNQQTKVNRDKDANGVYQNTIGSMTIADGGYDSKKDDNDNPIVNSYVSAITNTIKVTTLTIEKIWDDEEDRDQYRPDELTFSINRDGEIEQDGTKPVKHYELTLNHWTHALNSMTRDGQGNVTSTVAHDFPTDAGFKAYVKTLGGRSLGKYSIWTDSVTVPYYRNGSMTTTSTYTVYEGAINCGWYTGSADNAGYTTKVYDAVNGWTDGTSETATNGVAVFANVRNMDTFSIQAAKTWINNSNNGRWDCKISQTNGVDDYQTVTLTVPNEDVAYLRQLESMGLAFRLSYSVETTMNGGKANGTMTLWDSTTGQPNTNAAWSHPDYGSDDETKKWAAKNSADGTSVVAVHKVQFTYAPAQTTGYTTVTVKVDAWDNLPLYWYNAAVDGRGYLTNDIIHYHVEEGFNPGAVLDGSDFTLYKDAIKAHTDIADNWENPTPETPVDIIGFDSKTFQTVTVQSTTIRNSADSKSLVVSKSWYTQQVDANGKTAKDANGEEIAAQQIDATDLVALDNQYQVIPDSITYTVQYRTKGSNDAWTDATTLIGTDKATQTVDKDTGTYQYQATFTDLPAYVSVQGDDGKYTTAEVEYRAVETTITYPDNAAAAINTSAYTEQTLIDEDKDEGISNAAAATNGNVVATSETKNPTGKSHQYTTNVDNVIRLRTLTIEKIWDDEENRDGNRPDDISFKVYRDTLTDKSASVQLSKSDSNTIKSVPTAEADPAQIYKKAHTGRSIERQSVWTKTINVPYAQNTSSAASQYTVTETTYSGDQNASDMPDNIKYLTAAYQTTGWSSTGTYSTDGLAANTATFVASFANIRDKDRIDIHPVKRWTYDNNRWTNDAENVTTIDAAFKAYYEALQQAGLAFRLQYDIGNGYQNIDTGDQTVMQQIGSINPISTVQFTYGAETDGRIDVTTNALGWTGLSEKWYDAATLESNTIQYQVEEGFLLTDGSFVTMADAATSKDATVKALATMWTAARAENTTGITSSSTRPTFTNDLVTNRIEITKVLDEQQASETAKSQAIQYQLQYRAGEDDEWQNAPASWLRDGSVENGTYNAATQQITVARAGGSYPVVTITNLPKYTADGTLISYRVEETDPGVGYTAMYTVDGERQNDNSFRSTITNKYFTVNATIDKTWYDSYGFKTDVNTTVYQLQRREVSVADTSTNALFAAVIKAFRREAAADNAVPDPGAWTNVTYQDLQGARYAVGNNAATAIKVTKANADDPYQVTLTVTQDELSVTARVSNLVGVARAEDGYTTYYEYRFVENGMAMQLQGEDAGKTTAATTANTRATNDELTLSSASDGGYRLAYRFENYDNHFVPEKTFVSHVDAYIKTSYLIIAKDWNDGDNRDKIRPDELRVWMRMTITHDGEEETVTFDPAAANLASTGFLEKKDSYINRSTWAEVPVNDAYGDTFTYTFEESCPSGYQTVERPDAFTGEDGKTYPVWFGNFHYVPNITPGDGSDDGGHDDPAPVVPKVVPVEPIPEEPTIEETSSDSTPSDAERGEHYGDLRYGYFDEFGNWHYFDEGGNARSETGDSSPMTTYGVIAAMAVTVLAAWFVLYRRRRDL